MYKKVKRERKTKLFTGPGLIKTFWPFGLLQFNTLKN